MLEFLEEFAQDAHEVNHVFFFVRNCAGTGAELLNEENEKVLNVEEMITLLSKQRQELGLTVRQLSLLAVLFKATVQLLHDNQDQGNFYQRVNDVVVPHISELITTYRTDVAVYQPLVEIVGYLRFPDYASISSMAQMLLSLFESENSEDFGNTIVKVFTTIHVTELEGDRQLLTKLLHEECAKLAGRWSEHYKEISLDLTSLKENEMSGELVEKCAVVCSELGQLCTILCYQNEEELMNEHHIPDTLRVLLLDVPNTRTGEWCAGVSSVDITSVELRYSCHRFEQLLLLHHTLAAHNAESSTPQFRADEVVGEGGLRQL